MSPPTRTSRMAPALEVIVDEFMRQVRQQHADPS